MVAVVVVRVVGSQCVLKKIKKAPLIVLYYIRVHDVINAFSAMCTM